MKSSEREVYIWGVYAYGATHLEACQVILPGEVGIGRQYRKSVSGLGPKRGNKGVGGGSLEQVTYSRDGRKGVASSCFLQRAPVFEFVLSNTVDLELMRVEGVLRAARGVEEALRNGGEIFLFGGRVVFHVRPRKGKYCDRGKFSWRGWSWE
jgi:hypothetical protein